VYAINHAATALLFKRRCPAAPMLALLVGAQLVEVVWVLLNYPGVERVSTAGGVVRLAYMPYSHSVAAMLGWALLAWIVVRLGLGRAALAAPIALAVLSHLPLDLATHLPDIPLAPGLEQVELGSGLSGVPLLAFAVETLYGVLCWWVYRGSGRLLAAIVVLNLVNLPLFLAVGAAPNPNAPPAAPPLVTVSVVFLEILVTWFFVWRFADRPGAAWRPA
jgi:hypothetical protein